MTSKIGIANLALAALGKPEIVDFDELSKAADVMKRIYDAQRRAVLRAHPWNFATARATLQRLSAAPAWGWSHQHALPTDFLRMARVEDDPAFKIERGPPGTRRVVCADTTPLNILYIADVAVEEEFDPLFVTAFALQLAAYSAANLTGSAEIGVALGQDFKRTIAEARGVDAQENGFDSIEANDWNEGRI